MEGQFENFAVTEILREPYAGRPFPGFEDIDISFGEMETIVRNGRLDWKTTLENVKGIYLITDRSTGRRYVGSAYGEGGVWSRWLSYVETGHGAMWSCAAWWLIRVSITVVRIFTSHSLNTCQRVPVTI